MQFEGHLAAQKKLPAKHSPSSNEKKAHAKLRKTFHDVIFNLILFDRITHKRKGTEIPKCRQGKGDVFTSMDFFSDSATLAVCDGREDGKR